MHPLQPPTQRQHRTTMSSNRYFAASRQRPNIVTDTSRAVADTRTRARSANTPWSCGYRGLESQKPPSNAPRCGGRAHSRKKTLQKVAAKHSQRVTAAQSTNFRSSDVTDSENAYVILNQNSASISTNARLRTVLRCATSDFAAFERYQITIKSC